MTCHTFVTQPKLSSCSSIIDKSSDLLKFSFERDTQDKKNKKNIAPRSKAGLSSLTTSGILIKGNGIISWSLPRAGRSSNVNDGIINFSNSLSGGRLSSPSWCTFYSSPLSLKVFFSTISYLFISLFFLIISFSHSIPYPSLCNTHAHTQTRTPSRLWS